MGPGGQKHWISCSAMKHFEIMTITQLCFPLCRAKSSHGPHEHRTLSWVFQCKQPLPSQSIPKVDLQGPGEREAEEQPSSHQPRSQESRARWGLRNTTRRRSQTLYAHQGMCVDTSPANTFLLARVPKPLHSQFLFPGRALWVFLFISTPILPGQRTTLTPEQAPRQVVQGARECCLIRGKDEK